MKVAITGASGLVGSALNKQLTSCGHDIYSLVRKKSDAPDAIYWNAEKGEIETEKLEGLNAIVHLAGESIASGCWNDAVKKRIWDSRVVGTKLLADTLCNLKNPPQTLISASAMGYYGDRGEEWLTEDSPPDDSFLSRLCQEWEAAALRAEEVGIRVVCARIGLVVSKEGGALKNMLLPFKMGLGGIVGSGKQYISWITLEDLVRVLVFALENPQLAGPVNAVAPTPVTNREWTRALGKTLGRPTIFPLPAFVVRTALGEMGEALLLSSARIKPEHLIKSGFTFTHNDVHTAFRDTLS